MSTTLATSRLKYEMIFTRTDGVTADQMKAARTFAGEGWVERSGP